MPKKISSRVVFVKGRLYALSLQSSSLLIIPYFGVLKNSLFLPKIASNTATLLFTDIPALKTSNAGKTLALDFQEL
jgi:hypothetical protein